MAQPEGKITEALVRRFLTETAPDFPNHAHVFTELLETDGLAAKFAEALDHACATTAIGPYKADA